MEAVQNVPEQVEEEISDEQAEATLPPPKDIIDQLYPSRAKYRGLGPVDCSFPKEQPVAAINVQRPTNHDGEAMSVAVPVYATDTNEDLERRLYVMTKWGDERFRENNQALQIAQQIEVDRKNQVAIARAEMQRRAKELRKQNKGK